MHEKSLLQFQIFDRSVEEEMFLGMVEIRPKLVNGHTVDQWFAYAACFCYSYARELTACRTDWNRARMSMSRERFEFRFDTKSSTSVSSLPHRVCT